MKHLHHQVSGTKALSAAAGALTELDTGRVGAVVLAVLLGVFILFGAGFAQPNMLHNAAHDTRHAMSFPCH